MPASIRTLLAALASLVLLPSFTQDSREDESPAMPLVWYMRYEAREGMNDEARFRCARTVQYLNANFPETRGELYTTYHETRPWTLHRFIEAPDLESMEAVWGAGQEEGFRPMSRELREATVPETALDLLYLPVGSRAEEAPQARILRTARAKFSRMPEALRIAEEITAYLDRTYERLRVRTYVQDAGEVFVLAWTIDFDSIEHWHDALLRMLRDPAYEALLKKADEVFLQGSVEDLVMESGIG